MNAEERDIYFFFKNSTGQFVSTSDINRCAGARHQFRRNSLWAEPALASVKERGILETDTNGNYRLKPRKKVVSSTYWFSPDATKILKASGKDFGHLSAQNENDDEYYESL
jgi:hypothetical protein